MSDYIKGFDSGVDCVLTEIERMSKEAPITAQEVIERLDPQRDQKTPQKPKKPTSQAIPDGWGGLSMKGMPEKWKGNRAFIAGAKWAAKQLKDKNT